MTKVTAQMSVSLDGYYAGPRHTGERSGWLQSEEAAGFFRVTRWVIDAMAWRERQGFAGGEKDVNSDIIAESFEAAGAYVMGRNMADGGEVPWGDEPPFRAPVFVVTHRPRETLVRQGGTSFTYVTDGVASAVEQARAVAGGKNVAIAGGGTLLRQVFQAGLLDELELHIVPVVLGRGMSLFGADIGAGLGAGPGADLGAGLGAGARPGADLGLGLAEKEAIELIPTRVIHTPEVTHIRYTVNGRSALVLDDRGSGSSDLLS
ncbi:dihydrofolate reductase family protein [Streptosporangium sp. NPDC049078]|uniref:dihydrofolate reductase family protein n=1 Tax=Streptosporangium sp. NPDC049078 TaxID=3155767 RepID=UPI00342C05AB